MTPLLLREDRKSENFILFLLLFFLNPTEELSAKSQEEEEGK